MRWWILLLLALALLMNSVLTSKQADRQIKIEVPEGQHCVIKLHAIAVKDSKIHIRAEGCRAEVHDPNGNVITELPAGYNGILHLHLNCSGSGGLEVWLDHGVIYLSEYDNSV